MIMGGFASVAAALFFPSQTIIVQAKKYFISKIDRSGSVAVDVYEQDGSEALEIFLRRIDSISSFHLYLLNAQGMSLRTRKLPEGAQSLALRALLSSSVEVERLMSLPLVAKKITAKSGRDYIALLEMPMGLTDYLFQVSHAHFLRFLAALFASGLVCILLAKYLTSPIKKLQTAVHDFAKGDLSIRVASKIGNRKDEIADLGRDFDAMAARIETLMHAHERLLRDIAHELRSPLTRLNVSLEITRKHTDQEAKPYLNRIAQETDKLNLLITQILTLSRLEHADHALQQQPVILEEMIERIAQDAGFEGRSRDCSVVFTCIERCTLQADSNLLCSAVENVVRNALRFTRAGTDVQITQKICVEKGQRIAVIQCRDFGPGVPQDALEQMFQPFFRISDPHARIGGGAGLGLAIAFRAVSKHNGRITAANETDGGLMVEIHLPI